MAFLTQEGLDMLGLPQGEAAFTGGNGQFHDKKTGLNRVWIKPDLS
jgi:hypothetical protein